MKKLAWVVGIIGLWAFVLAKREQRRARLEAELWAAATDPLPDGV